MPETALSKEQRKALDIVYGFPFLVTGFMISHIAAALLEARADGIKEYGETGPCSCHEGFTSRRLRDPECAFHDFGQDAMENYERLRREAQQLREGQR